MVVCKSSLHLFYIIHRIIFPTDNHFIAHGYFLFSHRLHRFTADFSIRTIGFIRGI